MERRPIPERCLQGAASRADQVCAYMGSHDARGPMGIIGQRGRLRGGQFHDGLRHVDLFEA